MIDMPRPNYKKPEAGEESQSRRLYRMEANYSGKCAGCGDYIEKGMEMIFEPEEKNTLCLGCGETLAESEGREIVG